MSPALGITSLLALYRTAHKNLRTKQGWPLRFQPLITLWMGCHMNLGENVTEEAVNAVIALYVHIGNNNQSIDNKVRLATPDLEDLWTWRVGGQTLQIRVSSEGSELHISEMDWGGKHHPCLHRVHAPAAQGSQVQIKVCALLKSHFICYQLVTSKLQSRFLHFSSIYHIQNLVNNHLNNTPYRKT